MKKNKRQQYDRDELFREFAKSIYTEEELTQGTIASISKLLIHFLNTLEKFIITNPHVKALPSNELIKLFVDLYIKVEILGIHDVDKL